MRHDSGHQAKKGFPRFLAAVGLANVADGIAVVVWVWTASLLTRDPLWIAFLPTALRVPWLVFALPAGLLADRVDRRRLIMLGDMVRALCYGSAGIALFFHLPLSEPSEIGVEQMDLYALLLSLGFVIGISEVVRDNAAQTVVPALVAEKELEQANAWIGSVETVANTMIGPAIGAFLIAWFLPLPFLAMTIAFLTACLLAASLGGNFKPPSRVRRPWRAELWEAVRYVLRDPMLRVLLLVGGFWNFFAEMALMGVVLHVQENLSLDAQTYGIILAVGALGGLVGSAAMTPLLVRFSKGALANCGNISSAPVFLCIAFAPGPVAVAVAMVWLYFTSVIWDALSISYRHRTVPDALRGRVNSVYRLFAWGTMPLGYLASGALVRWGETLMPRGEALMLPFIVGAAGILIVALTAWRSVREGYNEPP